ncbi:MAG: protein of unknown function toxins and related Ca2+-binding protein, partial [Caulobacteraceae bacterium]|nr:protein of unknown function toxins and related Ca2+-binding protein [Caulobacteraceae bacterium]
DSLTGDGGDNTIEGGAGDDIMDGGAGFDTVSYANSTHAVSVTLNDLAVTWGAGPREFDHLANFEALVGSAYDDILEGAAGQSNSLYGGAGNDLLRATLGDEMFDGGTGSDEVNFAGFGFGVRVDLSQAGPQATGSGADSFKDIENVSGGSGDDWLTAAAGGSVLAGWDGNDRLVAGAGNDSLVGSNGIDTADYSAATAGVSVFSTSDGQMAATGGSGSDTLILVENIIGSNYDDVIRGDDASIYPRGGVDANQFFGGAGDDRLYGGVDNDLLYGGSGNDILQGGAGADVLDGGGGIDTASYADVLANISVSLAPGAINGDTLLSIENLLGSDLNDLLTGDSAANSLWGGVGDDVLDGGAGADLLDGGAGNDTADYSLAAAGVGVDLRISGSQNTGGSGADTLISIEAIRGSAFNDSLIGNAGANSLLGQAGDDILQGGDGDDSLFGGAGIDTASYEFASAGVMVGLGTSLAQNTLGAGTDTLNSIENLIGSNFDDRLTGSAGDNVLYGLGGKDDVEGGDGADTLYGGDGDDSVDGGGGINLLFGGAGVDRLRYMFHGAVTVDLAAGTASGSSSQTANTPFSDTLSGFENIVGSTKDDVLRGDEGINAISGFAGNDDISGRGGDDVLTGEFGDDVLTGGGGNDSLDGGDGIDTAVFTGVSTLYVLTALGGGSFSVADQVGGRDGTDTLTGVELLQFADQTYDLRTLNVVTGTSDPDHLHAGPAADFIYGGDGDDVVDSWTPSGADRIFGGAGTDTASYASSTTGVRFSEIYAPFFGLPNVLQATPINAPGLPAGQQILFSIERVIGSDFSDDLSSAAVIHFYGGGGDDFLEGLGDLYGGEGDDAAISGEAGGHLYGGAGNDDLSILTSFDLVAGSGNLDGGDGDDILRGNAGSDRLDGGNGSDTAEYSFYEGFPGTNPMGVTVDLRASGPQNTGAGLDILVSIENLVGSNFNDILTGDGDRNILTGGGGNDTLDGGGNIDAAVFSGAMSAYTITSNGGTVTVVGPDGTDTLTNIELLQFSDQTFHFHPGTPAAVDFTAPPSTYAAALRDFDGNNLGGSGSWVLAGHVDIQGDRDQEYILFNQQIGRWATIGPAADGRVYFDDHSWAGDTRVVGIYIDPEVVADPSKLGGPFDSQRRFQNDLNIGNLKGILGAGDYNHDGLQEVYFSLTEGSAYLHAYMHADCNIQYANYQSQAQVTDYLTANGYTHTTWDGWF